MHVRPTTTAKIEARLVATRSVAHLAVTLETPRGDVMPQPDRDGSHLVTMTAVTAAARFEFSAVPIGRHLLRIGTPEQLKDGESLHERWIEVADGESAVLKIQLSNSEIGFR